MTIDSKPSEVKGSVEIIELQADELTHLDAILMCADPGP